jgi:hypothetical protein
MDINSWASVEDFVHRSGLMTAFAGRKTLANRKKLYGRDQKSVNLRFSKGREAETVSPKEDQGARIAN